MRKQSTSFEKTNSTDKPAESLTKKEKKIQTLAMERRHDLGAKRCKKTIGASFLNKFENR